GVVVAALDLVPGVAADAVVAGARRRDDPQRVGDLAGGEEVPGDLVLAAGPDLVGVGEGEARLAAVRPGAEDQPGLIIEDVGALRVDVVPEVVPEVVPDDGLERGSLALRRNERPEAEQAGVPLAEELIGQAAEAVLVAERIDVGQA